jgi:hypothetical protein
MLNEFFITILQWKKRVVMKKLILGLFLFAVFGMAQAQSGSCNSLSTSAGRYVLGQTSTGSALYLLDSQTGKVWEMQIDSADSVTCIFTELSRNDNPKEMTDADIRAAFKGKKLVAKYRK